MGSNLMTNTVVTIGHVRSAARHGYHFCIALFSAVLMGSSLKAGFHRENVSQERVFSENRQVSVS